MTPSFDRGEAGRAHDVGRTDGAARVGRGCPISNSNLCAGVISHPKASSVGTAALTPIFPPQCHPTHPGLVSLPGSQSVLAGVHSPPNTPSDGPVCFLDGAGGCVLFPTFKRSRAILSLTKRHEPA